MSQTTQMESGALPCRRCQGDGLVYVQSPACPHTGNCPCGSVELECPKCEGSGVAGCDHCGEPASRLVPYTRQPICAECHERMYESEGDSSGSWDRAAEYAEQMASARRLK